MVVYAVSMRVSHFLILTLTSAFFFLNPTLVSACSCVLPDLQEREHSEGMAVSPTTWMESGKDALPDRGDGAVTSFLGKMWYVGGLDSLGRSSSDVFSSSDGRTWKKEGNLPQAVSNHTVTSFRGKLWVLGGLGHEIVSSIFSSIDGKTWKNVGTLPTGLDSHAVLVFKNTLWILGGHDSETDGPTADTYSSTDGVTWQKHENALPSSVFNHSAVVFRSKMFVIGGGYPGHSMDPTSIVYSSDDGIHWKKESSIPVAVFCHTSVVHRGKLWVFGGMTVVGSQVHEQKHTGHDDREDHEGWQYRHTTYFSLDGKTWTEEKTSAPPTHVVKNIMLSYRGRAWILGGAFSRHVLSSLLLRPR